MEKEKPNIVSPFVHSIYVMLKPAGARCNLSCRYCYYLEKSQLYAGTRQHVMSDSLLEEFTRQYIAMQPQREVLFTWHGGETMLRPLSFYQNAIALQQRYAGRHVIDNCIQTNGTLLTDEWCRFLHDNGWLVGLSIDGPQPLHDAYRKDRRGGGTHHQVMRAIEMLDRYGVMWNVMAVVNHLNADHPREFYRFFRNIGCRFIQFTPIVETIGRPQGSEPPVMTPESVTPRQWGDFLCAVFDEWVREDVGEYSVQIFESTLANYMGIEPGVCSLARKCGHALVMEFNGDVYSCDHFVFPEHRLGNMLEQPLHELVYSAQQNVFRSLKTTLPQQCQTCPYEFACHGECPKNRLLHTADGEPGLNYLCQGYRQFFAHTAPFMRDMAASLISQKFE